MEPWFHCTRRKRCTAVSGPQRSSWPRVAIIGAGLGGIATAVRLRQAGIEATIYERRPGIGGTWWDNVYPGAAVDTPSIHYSYSFHQGDFSRTHVNQPELQAYIEDVVSHFGLTPNIRLNAAVETLRWTAATQSWQVHLSGGEVQEFDIVVSAVGIFNEPNSPAWSHSGAFSGLVAHTANWDRTVDLNGKTVAVVGTGSTAVQVVPVLAPQAQRVLVFQRQPGWILPKNDRDLSTDERARLRSSPLRWRIARFRVAWGQERGGGNGKVFRPGTRQNEAMKQRALDYIDSLFSDHPDLKRAVTPDYAFYGKRPIVSSDFYPALLRDNVQLVTASVEELGVGEVVDSSGEHHPVDAVILATGFKAGDYLASMTINGTDGIDLHEHWAGAPEAFLGITVAGFPNFFMLYGPNTNGRNALPKLEVQAAFVASTLKSMRRWRRGVVDTRPSVQRAYNQRVQRACSQTIWLSVHNYYRGSSGKVVTQWPWSPFAYLACVRTLRRIGLFTRKARPPQDKSQRHDKELDRETAAP